MTTDTLINLAPQTVIARSLWARTRGLLGTRQFPASTVWVFPRTNLIHMWGMQYAIDVLFVDRHGLVRRRVANLRPGRIAGHRQAHWTIECPVGTVARLDPDQTYRVVQWEPTCRLESVSEDIL